MPRRWDEIPERLSGAGTGLNGEMLAGVHGAAHREGHRDLPGSLGSADPGDRGGQQGGDVGKLTGLARHV
jgi:hypothetical protein